MFVNSRKHEEWRCELESGFAGMFLLWNVRSGFKLPDALANKVIFFLYNSTFLNNEKNLCLMIVTISLLNSDPYPIIFGLNNTEFS